MAKPGSFWAAPRLNTIFFGGLVLWTALFLPGSILAWAWLVYGKKTASRTAIRVLVHAYGVVCCKLLHSQTAIETENRACPLPCPCVIVANHQSFFDPYCIGFFPVHAPVFVVRAWPFRIPLYGWIMRRAGYLNIEELDKDTFLQKARDVLAEKATLVVFPEGTRSTSGELGRFRSGAFKIAVDLDIPVVPMCIEGTGDVFPKGTRFGKPAPVKVTLLPPVYPAQGKKYGKLSHLYLQKRVKLAIREELQSMFTSVSEQ